MLPESDHPASVAIDLSTGSSSSFLPITGPARRGATSLATETRVIRKEEDNLETDDKRSNFFGRQMRKLYMLWLDRNSRTLLGYTVIAATLAIASIFYGSYTSSIGTQEMFLLILNNFIACPSDFLFVALNVNGIKVLYNALSMLILLNSMVLPKIYKSSFSYSYGYVDRFFLFVSFSSPLLAASSVMRCCFPLR